jgi:hypothetical protein
MGGIVIAPAQSPLSPLLLTAPEAALVLRISERVLWSLTAPRGPIPTVRIGRCLRYSVAELQGVIASRAIEAPGAPLRAGGRGGQ